MGQTDVMDTKERTAQHTIAALRDVEYTLDSLDRAIEEREDELSDHRKAAKERALELRQVLRERKDADGKILADARAMDAALTALEELISEREEQLSEARKEWKRQVGRLREIVRGSRQCYLPFREDDEIVDMQTGEVRVKASDAPMAFRLDSLAFNRRETKRAFEHLAEDLGEQAVVSAISLADCENETLTMEHYRAIEESIMRDALGEERADEEG